MSYSRDNESMTPFEAFYYDFKKKCPKALSWQIEDAYDAKYCGRRVYDTSRWGFKKKESNSKSNGTVCR